MFLTRGYQLYDPKGDELYRDNDGRLTTDAEEAIEMGRGNSKIDQLLMLRDDIDDLYNKTNFILNNMENKNNK